MWYKAVFKVGQVAGPKPTQNTFGPGGIPQRHQVINPTPPQGNKCLGDGPPEAGRKLQWRGTPDQIRDEASTAGRMRPNNWRGDEKMPLSRFVTSRSQVLEIYSIYSSHPATTITDADYADDIAILANTPDQAETLLHSLERAAASIGLHVNAHKTEYMCYN